MCLFLLNDIPFIAYLFCYNRVNAWVIFSRILENMRVTGEPICNREVWPRIVDTLVFFFFFFFFFFFEFVFVFTALEIHSF